VSTIDPGMSLTLSLSWSNLLFAAVFAISGARSYEKALPMNLSLVFGTSFVNFLAKMFF